MSEHTQQEAESFTKMQIAAQYCQVDADPLQELCKTQSFKPVVHPGVLANIPKADYTALLATVNTGGLPPTAGVLAQYGLIWETCQVGGGKQLRLEIDDVRDHELALAVAGVTTLPSTSVGTVVASPRAVVGTAAKTVTAESTTDQTDRKTEYAMLDPADIIKAYEKYDKRMGSGRVGSATVMPHPDEEPTGEQLSSLHGIDQAKSPPYVDFAVWGPYANRNRRRLVSQRLEYGGGLQFPYCGSTRPVKL